MTEPAYLPEPVSAPEPSGPTVPVTYDRALSEIPGAWRGVIAIVLLVVGFLLLQIVIGGVGILIEVARGALTLDELASGVVPITPGILLSTNISLALLIPLAMGLQRWLFGAKVGTLASVAGRFRWRWMGRLALVIVPVWVVYLGLGFLLDPGADVQIDGVALALIAIVILTTPLQAAGEEFGARGLIQRSAGSWFRNPVAAFVVSTLIASSLFALAHLAGDPWLIAYYFVFGASMSIAARGTGGLEAPVLMHATNNVLIFLPAVLLGQLEQGIDRSAGTGGPFMLVPMAVCLVGAGISILWARRNRIQVTAPPIERLRLAPVVAPQA
ncbi:CPBP family intramembrane glutamic endopeptidase [Salinibacterium sp.]|uniref:CPBP family intramembrane glutamic endopeptidase n=1 Tax=Salinibacterium sp. TaxID=1915057 RepID=UPI00286C8FC3|nr:CPBP family intramembrane glutamic endopeptidase [Salinibacterium sp.]